MIVPAPFVVQIQIYGEGGQSWLSVLTTVES